MIKFLIICCNIHIVFWLIACFTLLDNSPLYFGFFSLVNSLFIFKNAQEIEFREREVRYNLKAWWL